MNINQLAAPCAKEAVEPIWLAGPEFDTCLALTPPDRYPAIYGQKANSYLLVNSTTPKIILYLNGPINDGTPNIISYFEEVKNSGFNIVNLFPITVGPDGSISSHGFVLTAPPEAPNATWRFDPNQNYTQLASSPSSMLNDGSVTKLFFTIDGAAFVNIQKLMSTPDGLAALKNSFATLLKNLPMITGFDFDDETLCDPPTTAAFTCFLASFEVTITYCPYTYYNRDNHDQTSHPTWEESLEIVYKKMNSQPVAWLNLQCYSGGYEPSFSGKVSDWIKRINENSINNGVTNANAFIVPGLSAVYPNLPFQGRGDYCPSGITQQFAEVKNQVPGGFIWCSYLVFENSLQKSPYTCDGGTAPTIDQYAQAVSKGLNSAN